MKKCIVYYSKTGNTKSVVEQFKDFDVFKIEATSDDPNIQNPVLTSIPDIKDYPYVVVAGPVHGFQMSKIMKAYLEQAAISNLQTFDLFVTHFFPFRWMGGKQALNQTRKLIESKGGLIRYQTSIEFNRKHKQKVIDQMINSYHEETI